MIPGRRKALIFSLFFLSGVSALICQIVWIREFGSVFGVTVYAVSAVLTAFMAGLALGNLIFGQWADRIREPLRLFIALEAGIGLFVITFPLTFEGLVRLYGVILPPVSADTAGALLIRFSLAFLYLLIPTTLMGGTLPVLSRHFVSRLGHLGRTVGQLYGFNNLGAVIGGVIAGFVLLENIGLSRSLLLAGSLNLFNAVMVLVIRSRTRETVTDGQPRSYRVRPLPDRTIRLVLWIFALEGLTTLAYEVIWTRILLGISYDKSIYFTTTVIVTFILGLSIGGLLVARWIDGRRDLVSLFAGLEVAVGMSAIAVLHLFGVLASWLYTERASYSGSWLSTLGREYLLFFAVMLVPAILMGMTFPVVSMLCTRDLSRVGRRIGVIGHLDTIGSIFGASIAGFLLIPVLGVLRAALVISGLNIVLGITLWALHPHWTRRRRAGVSALAIIAAAAVLSTAPPAQYFRFWQTRKPGDRLLFYREGVSATVAVPQHPDATRVLAIDGSVTAFAEYGDIRVHKMLGLLPALLHSAPERALVIGLGMGITAQTLLASGTERVDCVEISPEVIEAVPCFSDLNRDVIGHPRLHTIVDDGRSLLFLQHELYDTITSNAVHARLSANLYTRDFYALCRRRLAPKGVMCQWFSTNWVTESEFKSLLAAFIDVFPNSMLWCVNAGHVLLTGTSAPLRLDYAALNARMRHAKIREEMRAFDLETTEKILVQYVCGSQVLRRYAGNVPPDCDDRPIAEFSKVVSKAQNVDIVTGLIGLRERLILSTASKTEQEALDNYRAAEKLYLEAVVNNYFRNRPDQAQPALEQAVERVPDEYRYREELASLYYNHGFLQQALLELEVMLQLHPGSPSDHEHLGMVHLDLMNLDEAEKAFAKALSLAPQNPLPHYHLASIYGHREEWDRAEAHLHSIAASYPDFAGTYYNLGLIYAQQDRHLEALKAFERCAELDPLYRDVKGQLQALSVSTAD